MPSRQSHAVIVRVGKPIGDAGEVVQNRIQGITTRVLHLTSSSLMWKGFFLLRLENTAAQVSTPYKCRHRHVASATKHCILASYNPLATQQVIQQKSVMAATAATPGRAYEDFVPPHNIVTEPATHTLSVDLTAAGYKKEHIRVQLVRSHRLVVVRGERAVAGNRWSRFRLEFSVPEGCDVKGIHARFEGGVVRVTMPGLRTGPAAAVGDVSGKEEPPAAKADASAGEKENEKVQKQPAEERGADAVKDSGRLDQGHGTPADDVRGVEAPAPASGRGYSYLPERRKLVTTVVGAVLVLFSLGIYVRYSFGP